MYTSRGFREWEIGDIDVIRRGRTCHLFHLVLPNHDDIAHAVSEDGMSWRRTRNAIFTGEPGSWDDDQIWTMHVSQSPARRYFEMFYTGLHRAENGFVQRIGRAVSRDLLRQGDQEWLLLCARVLGGQVNRRGCVGLVRRAADGYHLEPPLFYPRMYDDIECPCLVELEGTYYLIGSIREDVEVHYWFCESFQGEYRAFNDNVLMPRGNYATRVMPYALRLIRWGSYIELSVNGVVRLSLVDGRYVGRRLGIYLESAEVTLSSLTLRFLEPSVHDQA